MGPGNDALLLHSEVCSPYHNGNAQAEPRVYSYSRVSILSLVLIHSLLVLIHSLLVLIHSLQVLIHSLPVLTHNLLLVLIHNMLVLNHNLFVLIHTQLR